MDCRLRRHVAIGQSWTSKDIIGAWGQGSEVAQRELQLLALTSIPG